MPWMQTKHRVASSAARRNAPKLRKTLTEPETRLWRLLRQRLPLDGTHFRRQVALGPYVVDFVCLPAKLVIEIDGDQHGEDEALRYDATRTNWLQQQGYRVLRFSNRNVMTEPETVIDTILAALSGQFEFCPTPPTPVPSPQGGGVSGDA